MDEEALSTLNTKFHILVDSMNDKPEVTLHFCRINIKLVEHMSK